MNDIFISVIVPAYNGADNMKRLLDSLINQSVDAKSYEIIVVDNNSTDNTADVVRTYPQVTLLHHTERQSSYAARNEAIRVARGQYFAFTDADCVVPHDWINTILECIQGDPEAVFCGEVEFYYPDHPTTAELFDTMLYFNVKHSVEFYHCGVTANLIAPRKIFDTIGLFRDDLISSGDGEWSKRAHDQGHRVLYCPDIFVYHDPRDYKELCKKSQRVGYGLAGVWVIMGKSSLGIVLRGISMLLPKLNLSWRKVLKSGVPKWKLYLMYPQFFLLGWWCNWLMLFGFIKGFQKADFQQ